VDRGGLPGDKDVGSPQSRVCLLFVAVRSDKA
jgi:hypothetical protein